MNLLQIIMRSLGKISKSANNMADINVTINLDEFKRNPYKDEFKHLYPNKFYLTPTGWKMLMDYALSPLFEEILGLQYFGEYIWASPWDNHRRKVVRIFRINDMGGTLQWGWCFDFVPRLSGKKITYNRTDKSLALHQWELSEGFISGKGKERQSTMLSASNGKDLNEMAKNYRNTFNYLLPDIQRYFTYTDYPQNMLADIDLKLTSNYYRFMGELPFTICAAFISCAIGDKERGKDFLLSLKFNEDYKEVEQKLLAKLEQQQVYW